MKKILFHTNVCMRAAVPVENEPLLLNLPLHGNVLYIYVTLPSIPNAHILTHKHSLSFTHKHMYMHTHLHTPVPLLSLPFRIGKQIDINYGTI